MKNLTPAKLSMIMFMVIGGLVVAYVAKTLFAVDTTPQVIATRNVPMPVGDIEPGTMLTANHIGLGPIPISELKPDMLLNNRVIVGRIAKEEIKKATPIHASSLYEPGASPPLEVEEGMVAVTVTVSGSSGIVDGLIKPSQYCDVHLTVTNYINDERYNGGLNLTLFKGVRILAINRYTRQGAIERDGNSVTLELTPAQANIILLARERGMLALTYNPQGKGTGGIAVANADRVVLDDILGIEPKTPPAPEPPPFTAQIYRGAGRQQIQFGKNNTIIDSTAGPSAPIPNVPSTTNGSNSDDSPSNGTDTLDSLPDSPVPETAI